MKEGDRLYINRSKSGKGIYISNTDLNWMLIGNLQHLRDFVEEKKEYVVVEIRKKEQKNGTKN